MPGPGGMRAAIELAVPRRGAGVLDPLRDKFFTFRLLTLTISPQPRILKIEWYFTKTHLVFYQNAFGILPKIACQ